MDDFASLMRLVVTFFKLTFTIGKFTFSLWEVFLFSIIASIVLGFYFKLGN